MTFDSEIDQLVFGLWRDLPGLSDSDIAARVAGFEGVSYMKPFEVNIWDFGSWLRRFSREGYNFLSLGIENLYQHVDFSDSLVVASESARSLFLYLFDSGNGFVNSEGKVILKEASVKGESFGTFGDQGNGFSNSIEYADEFYAFSKGHALYRGIGEGLSDARYVPYPFDSEPAGALVCGRFFRK